MTLTKRLDAVVRTSRDMYGTFNGIGLDVQRRFGVSRPRQLAQILHYRKRLGSLRTEYYKYELYRPDMSEAERDRFIMQLSWNALSSIVNRSAENIDHSKLLQARRFADANVPVPKTLGYTSFAPDARMRAAREFVPLSELARIAPANGVVLKRERSMWGRGVLVFTSVERGIFRHADGRRFDTQAIGAALREQGGGFLIQERVSNHPALAALGFQSLGTLRVLTYGSGDNIRIGRAALKIPVGRTGIDNYHVGSIAAPVDLATGALSRGVLLTGMVEWLSSHPETGMRFEGLRVPFWDEVQDVARRAARSLPDCRCVGWDVAVTAEGARIIEGNAAWGTGLMQRPFGQGIWQGEFREWCESTLGQGVLPETVRRWLGMAAR